LYVDIKELNKNAADFVEYLKKTVNLAIIPGGHQFFGDQSEGYVRICIATSREILSEGLRRLKEGVQNLA
jgi:cystathionine beta-lyase